MISLKKRQEGFTLIELLIVIVVIGILATIVLITYNGIQAKARNAKRVTDLDAIQTQLEAFYTTNGYYPSYADLNSPSWVKTNMPSLEISALLDPSTTCVQSSSTNCLSNSATPPSAVGNYDYYPTDSTGSAANCEANDTTCSQYTLSAFLEAGGGVDTKVSLN